MPTANPTPALEPTPGRTPEQALRALGLTLPEPAAPLAAYVPVVVAGGFAYVSGQGPVAGGAAVAIGHLGAEVTPEQGYQAARVAGINVLAQLKAALGSLDRVARVVKLTVMVASTPDFTGHPGVANGASELLAQVFGEAGRHARSAFGVAALPLGWPVEVDAIVQLA
ncbi:MAG: RidA family protein [Bifidobacteriaceae bacterium]|jgi:enamine deaminase RidA (YjgF/YER057c/UK114 family)|nr:RidA family protein [Bifidobacteriaceae bacterium]